MVNYNNGKIYIIHPTIEYEEGDVYIGSTTKQYLSQRIQQHRTEYHKFKNGKPNGCFTVFRLFDKYGITNCDIFLVEDCNVSSKNELHAREGFHIRNMKCVNKLISGGRTREEELLRQKLYRETHKEEIRLYNLTRKHRVECPCGGCYTLQRRQKHNKTNIHTRYLETISSTT